MIDAHNHLHEAALDSVRDPVLARKEIHKHVVNGTCEADWKAVAALAVNSGKVLPAFGLHPWKINDASVSWLKDLEDFLTQHPRAAVGEIGLDRWIEGHDIEAQSATFCAQLLLAEKLKRVAVVHCLKAWGRLIGDLEKVGAPGRGFLSHAFSGSREVAAQLHEHGAYFSFSGYFLQGRKSGLRELYAWLPLDRILVETDAPHMSPPPEYPGVRLLEDGNNHPANLELIYKALAELRGISTNELIDVVEANFRRLFGTEDFSLDNQPCPENTRQL